MLPPESIKLAQTMECPFAIKAKNHLSDKSLALIRT